MDNLKKCWKFRQIDKSRNKSVIKIHHSINASTFWFGAKSVFTNFFRFVDIFCPDFQSVSSVRNPGNAKISTGFYSTWALRKFRRFSIFPYLVHVGAVRHAVRFQTTLSSQTPGGITLTKRGGVWGKGGGGKEEGGEGWGTEGKMKFKTWKKGILNMVKL